MTNGSVIAVDYVTGNSDSSQALVDHVLVDQVRVKQVRVNLDTISNREGGPLYTFSGVDDKL